MNTKAWEYLKENHQWFLLFAMFCLFVGSLLVFSALADSVKANKEKEQSIVMVEVDGMELEVATWGRTVGDVIRDSDIYVGPNDLVIPTLAVPITEINSIRVLRVTKEVVTETQVLDVETEYIERNDMEIGTKIVMEQGQEGLVENTVEVRYMNGKEIGRTIIARNILQEHKNRVVASGVMDIITRDGVTFSFAKVLDNAELTAYSAGYEHTGKHPGDYWYGMTATGTRVQDGRTVAVDPKVIPLGWWMYIEGYGFRRAEDTGSAVRNKRVDIYFENNDLAHAFGLKRGVKVYVIGPNDPR